MKQWSPRCSEAIRGIYQNQAIKGMQFVAEGLEALKEELRVYKKADLNERFSPTSFLQALRIPLKLEADEAEASCQLNFKLTKNVFLQIDRYREKGFTDSELLEAFVYLMILRRSPTEILEEERKEAPETETREPLEKKAQTRQKEIIKDLLANRCHNQYFECVSEPFLDKDERFYINCPKPIFKKDRYGKWIPSGKFHGKIPIEQCSSMQRSQQLRDQTRKKEISKEEFNLQEIHCKKEGINKLVSYCNKWCPSKCVEYENLKDRFEIEEAEEAEIHFPIPKQVCIGEISKQIGVCKNPLIMRQLHSVTCAFCKKKDPKKREACDLVFEELETSSLARMKFIEAMTSRKQDWWQSPKTEDMSLEEIEEELGLRSNLPSYEDLKSDAFRKRYNELCANCEEHLKHRCYRYCREFLNGLELPREVAS